MTAVLWSRGRVLLRLGQIGFGGAKLLLDPLQFGQERLLIESPLWGSGYQAHHPAVFGGERFHAVLSAGDRLARIAAELVLLHQQGADVAS